MNRVAAALTFLAMCLPAAASPTTPAVALLEVPIKPSAVTGDVISLRDAQCRYSGQLVRASVIHKNFEVAVTEAAGADTGRWHIDISQRTCGQQTEAVQMRVNLPKPPSLAGGGGFPALPYGYEAGTRFTLLPKNYRSKKEKR